MDDGRLTEAGKRLEREAKQREQQEEARRIYDAYRKLFKTPNGKIVLADLRRLYYDRPLRTADTTVMAMQVGAHDVVEDIIRKTQPLPESDLHE